MNSQNSSILRIRTIDPATPFLWIRRGLADLRACPGPSLFYGVCFAFMGFLLAYVLRGEPAYLAAVTAGFLLLGPALTIGVCAISRRREMGAGCALWPTLTAWKDNSANLGLFSLVLIVIFLVWARASLATFAMFFSGSMPDIKSMLTQLVAPENYGFLFLWLVVGAIFALLAFSISIIAIPLMIDRRSDAVTAARASIQVLLKNPGAMAMWAAIIAWTGAASLLMGFLGLIFVAPLLGHASWHAYRDLVETESTGGTG
jgi:uncharacterized membrane protein